MKKLLLTLVLVISTISLSFETTLSVPLRHVRLRKADFLTTLSIIREHEGFYANNVHDRGGETYGGISRLQFPRWYGWTYVDQHKRRFGELKWNQHLVELDFWVQDFYLDLWVKEGFDELDDQLLANYIFDFRVNGTIGAMIVQRTLGKLGQHVVLNNRIDTATVRAVNRCESTRLLHELRANRIAFYRSIVKRDKSQRVFLRHWLQRANRFV